MQTNFEKGGSAYLSARIREGIENGTRMATVHGCWEIEAAVRLPSHFTLVLEDCHLKMADGVYDNMFVNEHHDTPLGCTVEGTDCNINIIGRGVAILDGGTYNGLSEKTQGQNGLPPIWKNNLILFTNVNGFKISGLSCRRQRWWALNFIYCANGYLGNLDFCADDTGITEKGEVYHGLRREKYCEVMVKNADGIDLRAGCHHITIENITGFTEDDTVALTGLNGRMERTFAVEGMPSDICHVEIRKVEAAAFCTLVRLLNQGGVRLHDILVDGVRDMAQSSPHMDHGRYAVRVGDTHLYGERHSTTEETYNITVRNVVGAGDYVIALAGQMKNFALYGIACAGETKMLLDRR